MNFYTERLLLRPFKNTDAASLFDYASDERVGPIAGWPAHTSVENSQEIIKTVLSDSLTYAICLKESPEVVIGSIGIMLHTQEKRFLFMGKKDAEVGYWLGVPFWGQGIIPEAFTEIMRYAFEELKVEAIWCGYFDENEQSKKVQEKAGLRYVRTEMDIEVPLLNLKRTEHFSRITKEEWENISL